MNYWQGQNQQTPFLSQTTGQYGPVQPPIIYGPNGHALATSQQPTTSFHQPVYSTEYGAGMGPDANPVYFNSANSTSSQIPMNMQSGRTLDRWEAKTIHGDPVQRFSIALYDYQGMDDNELSFKEGDILSITQIDDSGWSAATLNGRKGWIPENYTEALNPKPAIAIQDLYVHEGTNGLTFRKGDVVNILRQEAGGRCTVEFRGVIGKAPAKYLN